MTAWRVRLHDDSGEARDVLLHGRADTSVSQIVERLGARGIRATGLWVNGQACAPDATLADIDLAHGDVVGTGQGSPSSATRAPGTYVVVVSGPHAGQWAVLPTNGSVTVGRGREADLRIRDALISSQHASIASSEDGLTVRDLGTTNGTVHEGRRIAEPTTVSPGGYLQIGSSVLTLLRVAADDLPVVAPAVLGTRTFNRHFRRAEVKLPDKLAAPKDRDDRNRDGGRSWWQYLLPLATGVGFAAMTGRWIFLLIMAISPIAMLVQYLRKQKADEEDREKEQEAHDQAVQAHRSELDRQRRTEQARRRREAIVGGEAVLTAEFGMRQLWSRQPGDDDFMRACVGLASQASSIDAGDDTALWAVPLNVDLVATGSLLVIGALQRARAVGRSMVLNLTTTHAPSELNVTILTSEETSDHWNWARYLPHTFGEAGTSRIFTTPDQRDAGLTGIMQQLEALEESESRTAHLVVVDGALIVDGGRLTTLLRRGVEVGIHGLVLDEAITPEGVRGTLTLGDHPDEGSFVSHTLSRVDGILTAELSAEWADRAARGMAPLQPSAAMGASSTPSQVHLTDQLADGGSITAAWIADRWRSTSPASNVTVGVSGRTPIDVDIVKHGPHAIVGGATRSGKTEFLLTWLTSLCLANTVDDLAIVVADFKGGVDHVQTEKLPHVISLATNKDIRAFERTMVMLEAEVKRREDLFESVGTSNLDAYRVKRQRDDSLMAVPRLLVVVDEFSELRQTDKESSGGYMNRLESLSRVGAGLGMHLVLVTQNFAGGQLPDQIDGQVGLGVCFRVEANEHSKVVLRSPLAATVPADRPGRAWARKRGLDLQEFQSARVAGRRRELEDAEAAVAVEFVPFATVAMASGDDGPNDVPHDETDLNHLIEVLAVAAAGDTPPVPWPDELRGDLLLADLLRPNEMQPEIVVGVADVPEKQQQAVVTITAEDEQILLLGSSAQRNGEALLTLGVATVLRHGPADAHLYGIDLEGSTLQPLAALPNTGAVACLNDDLGRRIVARLAEEVSRRRASFDELGVATIDDYERRTGERLPRIRLLVNGADRLVGSSEGDASPLLRPIAALAADAPATGIGIVLAGAATIAGKKMTQRATRRFVQYCADPSLYSVAGVPRGAVVDFDIDGRAYDASSGRAMQWGSLSSADHAAGEVVAALGVRLAELHEGTSGWPDPLPEVRWPLPWSRIDTSTIVQPPGYVRAVPVGVDTDTAMWTWVDIVDDGPMLAIGGPGKSGRSTALLAMAACARQLDLDVLAVAPTRRSPLHASLKGVAADLSGIEPVARPTILLVDDANRLDDGEPINKLLDESTAPLLVVLAGPVDMFRTRTGLLRGLPELRVTVTIGDRGSSATGGERIPDHLRAQPRAGRGVVWNAGEFTGIQVPLPPDDVTRGPRA